MNLRCSAQDCLHNKNSKCTSSIIRVVNDRPKSKQRNYCSTFTKDEGTYLLTAMERMTYPLRTGGIFSNEFAEELYVTHTRDHGSPAILCGVSGCSYNKNGSCFAGDIAIGRPFRRSSLRHPCKTFSSD